MIIKGSQRAGATALGLHLLRRDENDHVEVHEIRGLIARDVVGAFREVFAVSRATKCRQFLFSVSFSPPSKETVPVEEFERAIGMVEKRMGLEGLPRVVVFHEKDGRRHAHCVWSRIRATDLKAVNLPHFRLKLREISRELYFENSWTMPRGLVNSEERNPLNFTREEWQQAKRLHRDPKRIKQMFMECWAISDGLPAFRNALEARGLYLAQGDRRGFVATDVTGAIYSLSRWCGVSSKEMKAKLGDPAELPTAESIALTLAAKASDKVEKFIAEASQEFANVALAMRLRRGRMVVAQRQERQDLRELQVGRWSMEASTRLARFRRGILGLWDRVTGHHKRVVQANEQEVRSALRRDIQERESLIAMQLSERRALRAELQLVRTRHTEDVAELRSPLPRTTMMEQGPTQRGRRLVRRAPSP